MKNPYLLYRFVKKCCATEATYQVGEVVTTLALHQSRVIAETGDKVDVALESCRIAFQHDEDEGR